MLVNFLAAAAIMTRAAKSGPTAIGGAALGGYVAPPRRDPRRTRAVAPPSWIDLPSLGFVIVGTHLGLLFWEMKYVSLTLAAPGLKPARPSGDQ